jgi:hypothetical protein
MTIVGLSWEQIQLAQQRKAYRKTIQLDTSGDYGADPLGDGLFCMVPSGDVVDYAERCWRLNK